MTVRACGTNGHTSITSKGAADELIAAYPNRFSCAVRCDGLNPYDIPTSWSQDKGERYRARDTVLAAVIADHAPAQRTKRAPHALQRGGRIGHGAEHVGRGAKGTVDLVEHGAHSAGGGGTVNEGDAGDGGRSSGHGVFLEGHEGD